MSERLPFGGGAFAGYPTLRSGIDNLTGDTFVLAFTSSGTITASTNMAWSLSCTVGSNITSFFPNGKFNLNIRLSQPAANFEYIGFSIGLSATGGSFITPASLNQTTFTSLQGPISNFVYNDCVDVTRPFTLILRMYAPQIGNRDLVELNNIYWSP